MRARPRWPACSRISTVTPGPGAGVSRLCSQTGTGGCASLAPAVPAESAALRNALEKTLSALIEDQLREVDRLFPATVRAELLALAPAAAERLLEVGSEEAWLGLATLSDWPEARATEVATWRRFAAFLLTQKKTLRKTVNKNSGFLARSDEKARMVQLLEDLASVDRLESTLARTLDLPDPQFDDSQWDSFLALIETLRIALYELGELFAAANSADYPELARAALAALGPDDAPTDLALALDYRIRHLLVDEMQDTSLAQYELIARLTRGFTPGDGRSLFCVGDPMQSIYRFREAEVGRFIAAARDGIGGVALTPLGLSANFRSSASVVAWYNAVFSTVFPASANPGLGAVPYVASTATKSGDGAVTVHPLVAGEGMSEADAVVASVQSELAAGCRDIAILARARGHLVDIAAALRARDIGYDSVEIERLTDAREVQDLISLTRALLHEADRCAWIALLRGPWCALPFASIERLVRDQDERTVREILADDDRLALLDNDERDRVALLLDALDDSARALHSSLAVRVERAWFALGAPMLLQSASECDNAYRYLAILRQHVDATGLLEPTALERVLESEKVSYAGSGDARIQLMTIHKSKGLEFDCVILPGLGKRTRIESVPLLQSLTTLVAGTRESTLISVAASRQDAETDPLHSYLATINRAKAANELDRLLYVACTRARNSLHLVGTVERRKDGALSAPRQQTLLARLWPAIGEHWNRCEAPGESSDTQAIDAASGAAMRPATRRFQGVSTLADGSLSSAAPGVAQSDDLPAPVEYSWVGREGRAIGTVVHAWLQRLAETSAPGRAASDVRDGHDERLRHLKMLGLTDTEAGKAERTVARALEGTVADATGNWLLFGPFERARSELALSELRANTVHRLVLDRVIEEASGQHWIVDYKTGIHEGGGLDEFIASEVERYTPQLLRYRSVYRRYCEADARIALYFPLQRRFVELSV